MEKAPLAGTSPAPKQGPQKQERMEAPGGHKGGNVAPPGQLQVDGLAGGIDRQPELAGADGAAVQDLGRPHDILVSTAGAAGDDSLTPGICPLHNLLPQ